MKDIRTALSMCRQNYVKNLLSPPYWINILHLDIMGPRVLTMVDIPSTYSVEMVSLVTEKSVNRIQTWMQFLTKDLAAPYQTVERSVHMPTISSWCYPVELIIQLNHYLSVCHEVIYDMCFTG